MTAFAAEQMAISTDTDIILIRRRAKFMAKEIGFNLEQQEEVSLVSSELATNLLKHAGRGTITLQPISETNRIGIAIISQDNGKGFNSQEALQDGYSCTNSLGCGLGTVNRLVDELTILTPHENHHETYIACKKWLPCKKSSNLHCPFDIGVISRPKPGQEMNGDAFIIKHDNTSTLIGVIDGLGHGASAAKASIAAKYYIEKHYVQSLLSIFQGADRACLGSNGVVMALARIEWHLKKLTFASVGNIEAKIVGGETKINLPLKRGIVGRLAPTPKIFEIDWQFYYGIVLHSDGLTSKWSWNDFSYFADKPAQSIAEHMHRKLQKGNDDATLIFLK